MNKLTVMLVLSGLLVSGAMSAQQNRSRANRGEHNRMSQAEQNKKWTEIQNQLKKKYPEKFAEIENLARTNLAEAMQKMIELAREAKIDLPGGRGFRGAPRGEGFGGRNGGPRGERFGGRDGGPRGERFGGGRNGVSFIGNRQRREAEAQIKAKFPKEYAEIEQAQEQNEAKLQALAKKADVKLPLTQEALTKKMNAVREKYKAEFEEIDKLWATDPQGARERSQEIYQREGVEVPFLSMMNFRRPDQRGGRGEGRERQPARRGGQDIRKKMENMQKAYPEEMKTIMALRQEDPQKFRSEMRKLAERYDREHPAK